MAPGNLSETRELAVRCQTADISPANGRGKGKLKLRANSNGALGASRGASALSVGRAEKQELPDFRFPEWLGNNEIASFDVSGSKGHNEAWEVLRNCMPAVLRKSSTATALLDRWNMPYLSEAFGRRRGEITVLCSDGKSSVYLEHDEHKNAFGSFYHVREPATQQLRMSFQDFSDCLSTWSSKKVFARVEIMQGRSIDNAPWPCENIGEGLKDDLTSCIDWHWLQEAQHMHRWGGLRSMSLEMGSANGLHPAQYQIHDRLFIQVTGRRRVLLVSPSHAFAGMYPFPMHHPYDGYAMPDLDTPDLHAWPLLQNVRGQVTILRPGDLLFIPAFWFAHVQDMDAGTTCLSLKLGMGLRLQSTDAMTLAVSRLVEERVGMAEGPADIRKWLLIIAREDEERMIDVATVAGYRQVVMCQEVRDEIEAVIGPDASVRDMLLGMCDRRLLPTPWVNQNFREPLYLTDKPRLLPDTRTEEEIKYPELFRHRVQAH